MNSEQLIKYVGSEALLNRLGALGQGMIQRRVEKGLEPEYTDAYLKKREEAGIIDAGKVRLEFTGESMQMMTHKAFVNEKTVKIYFADPEAERIMSYHDNLGAGKNKVLRPFMFLEESEQQEIFEEYEEDVIEKFSNFEFF